MPRQTVDAAFGFWCRIQLPCPGRRADVRLPNGDGDGTALKVRKIPAKSTPRCAKHSPAEFFAFSCCSASVVEMGFNMRPSLAFREQGIYLRAPCCCRSHLAGAAKGGKSARILTSTSGNSYWMMPCFVCSLFCFQSFEASWPSSCFQLLWMV